MYVFKTEQDIANIGRLLSTRAYKWLHCTIFLKEGAVEVINARQERSACHCSGRMNVYIRESGPSRTVQCPLPEQVRIDAENYFLIQSFEQEERGVSGTLIHMSEVESIHLKHLPDFGDLKTPIMDYMKEWEGLWELTSDENYDIAWGVRSMLLDRAAELFLGRGSADHIKKLPEVLADNKDFYPVSLEMLTATQMDNLGFRQYETLSEARVIPSWILPFTTDTTLSKMRLDEGGFERLERETLMKSDIRMGNTSYLVMPAQEVA